MTRRELRDCIFKLLFRVEFYDSDEIREQEALFFQEYEKDEEYVEISEEDKAEISDKLHLIIDKIPEIDKQINEKTEGWNVSRLGKVELTVLRLAVYEIGFDEAIPTGVAINEAVELAKKYGQEDSSAFINGVLAKFA